MLDLISQMLKLLTVERTCICMCIHVLVRIIFYHNSCNLAASTHNVYTCSTVYMYSGTLSSDTLSWDRKLSILIDELHVHVHCRLISVCNVLK